jgi:hypothetical protein
MGGAETAGAVAQMAEAADVLRHRVAQVST